MKGKKSDGDVGWFPSSHVCRLNDNTKSKEDTTTVPLSSGNSAHSADPNNMTKTKPSNIDTSLSNNKSRSGSFSQQMSLPGQVSDPAYLVGMSPCHCTICLFLQSANSVASPTVFKFPDVAIPGTPGGPTPSNRAPATPHP